MIRPRTSHALGGWLLGQFSCRRLACGLALLVGWCSTIQVLAAHTALPSRASALFAGNAAQIDNAEPLAAGQLETDLDVTYAYNRRIEYAQVPLVFTYGLLSRWDASLAVGAEWMSQPAGNGRQTHSGFADTLFNTKFKLVDQDELWMTQSLNLGIKIPTASRSQGLGTGNPDFDLAWMASKDLSEHLTADLNFGYTWIGDSAQQPMHDGFHYGVALEWQAARRLSLVGQFFAATPSDQIDRSQFGMNVGIGWQFSPRLSAHASFTKGFGSMVGYMGTVGVTWIWGRLP